MSARIAVLVSGGGTNLQALIDAQGSVLTSGKIELVVSNVPGAYALERAKKAGIATEVVVKKELMILPCAKMVKHLNFIKQILAKTLYLKLAIIPFMATLMKN